VHLGLAGVRDRVAAELNIGTVLVISQPLISPVSALNHDMDRRKEGCSIGALLVALPSSCCILKVGTNTHFLLMKYLSALPSVWSSFSIWNDVACDEAPGSYSMR
jgi:hypothetical protein